VDPPMLLLLPAPTVDVVVAPGREAPDGGCVLKLVSHVPVTVCPCGKPLPSALALLPTRFDAAPKIVKRY